jgi:hypothetical protein
MADFKKLTTVILVADNQNFLVWENSLKLCLKYSKCWVDVIQKADGSMIPIVTPTPQGEAEEFKVDAEKDLKAMMIINSSVHEAHQIKLQM